MLDLLLWIVLGAGAAAVLVCIALSAITDWFNSEATSLSKAGALVKERLDNGNYRIVGGIFSSKNFSEKTLLASNAWEAESLDDELEELFEDGDQVAFEM